MADSSTRGARGRRVLVAEDLALSGELVSSILRAGGYEADVVEDGAEAVEAVRLGHYHLVLMDIEMPLMDGYTASRAIRNLSIGRPRLPVVALTAKSGKGEAERCRQAGIDSYLAKPFEPSTLLREIARWIGPRPSPSQAPVWDKSIYREIADRLGPIRMEKARAMFEDHLVRSLAVIATAPGDPATIERETHGLVSIAGVLGFMALSELSGSLMKAPSDTALAIALRDAGDRALAALRDKNQTLVS